MKKQDFSLLTFLLLLIISPSGYSQSLHIIEVSNFVFTPASLTVEVGDKVRWMNIVGNHNVVADDNSFTNGPPSTDLWIFDFVFTAPGNNPYYCVVHGGPGGVEMSGVIIVELPVSISDDGSIVNKFELNQNYPNPFNPTTAIKYSIPVDGVVTLRVFNAIGEEVSTLVNEFKEAGNYEINFSAIGGSATGGNAYTLTSGIYFYKLQAGDFVETKKMVLLR